MALMRLRRLIYTRITTKITWLPPRDFDWEKHPIGKSGTFFMLSVIFLRLEGQTCDQPLRPFERTLHETWLHR
jgi:hypothetical protein